jgi:transketolase
MQAIPGIRVYAPIDGNDLARAMNEAMEVDGPTYIRLARFPSPQLTPSPAGGNGRVADFHLLRDGADLTVLTTGTLTTKVLDATDKLKARGISAKVVGITRLKPIADSIADIVARAGAMPVAVVEEHSIHGGLADMVSSLLDRKRIPHCLARIGIADRFGESGAPEALLEAFGLAGEPLVQALSSLVRRSG